MEKVLTKLPHLIWEYQVPFCKPFLCSGSNQSLSSANGSDLYLWKCLPPQCRQHLEIYTAVLLGLALLTTTFNLFVVAANLTTYTRRILQRNITMQNYSNYVLSLSLADSIMGAFVLPLAAFLLWSEMVTWREVPPPLKTDIATSNFTMSYFSTITAFSNATATSDNRFRDGTNITWNELSANASGQTSFKAATKRATPLVTWLGVLTHFSVFVSMYTLAAASADRFYISTKPIISRSIRLSRSSFRRVRINTSQDGSKCSSVDMSRSTVVVLIIWMTGLFFSISPLYFISGGGYHTVGHILVAVHFHDSPTLAFLWYTLLLALPLIITWIFSFLLCVSLRKRKKKLKKPSRNLKYELSDRKPTDWDGDSSFAQTSRYSNTETPVVAFSLNNNCELTNHQEKKNPEYCIEHLPKQTRRMESSLEQLKSAMKNNENSAKSFLTKKRPSSYDSSWAAPKVNVDLNGKIDEFNESLKKVPLPERQQNLSKYVVGEGSLPVGYVAKRILCRRSWNGYVTEPEQFLQPNNNSKNISPLFPKRSESMRHPSSSILKCSSPTPSPSIGRRSDISRYARPSSRVRRRSSVHRAKEFLRSNSFESNIAKTLFAIIIAITVAVVPLLVALSLVSRDDSVTLNMHNTHVTTLVVTVTILLSNSFWNCLIYGTRMPYFRSALSHIINKTFHHEHNYSCPKAVGRKFSLTTRLFRRELDVH